MFDLHSFIPSEMTVAPQHSLAEHSIASMPEIHNHSAEEIQEAQRQGSISGIIKRIIPLDAETSWEYWWCVPGRILLAEDVELLQQDRTRIETILGKLIWLFGGCCFGDDTQRLGEQPLIYDWQQVLEFARQHEYESYVLDIDFMPTAITPLKSGSRNSTSADASPTHVAVEPAHWHIEFFRLQSAEGGFELEEPKNLCSCLIWTGKPFLKDLQTGVAQTRYDLRVSQPQPLTNPPWPR